MARIHEVAREAGVSITTVSHVFSGKRPVAADTAKRVRQAASRVGYLPDITARGLATGRSMTLAIAFPFSDDSFVLDPYFGRLLEGFAGAAAEAGYGFLLVPASPKRSSFPLTDLLRERRFDGAIVADPAEHDDLVPLLRRHGVPIVTTGRYGQGRSVPWVDNDNRGGMRQLLTHVEEMGYRRPALISMSPELSYARDIEEEFRAWVGKNARVEWTQEVTEEAGYTCALELLDVKEPPDVILAASDRQALGALRAARELDVAVPQELGVAGSGDTIATHSHPAMTSVQVQTRELGEMAVNRLLTLIDGGTLPLDRVLETRLVVRESTSRRSSRVVSSGASSQELHSA